MFDNRPAVDASHSHSHSRSAFSDGDEMSTLLQQILLRSSNQCTNFLASQNPNSTLQPTPDVPIGEMDECDNPSEEGLEALVEEATKRRRSSKRRRAAEVHNMSEKRRRSRINEKMKALLDLIPNSNKTDKASMLDEAIEYLKQLQLQVQMLTLRNGLMLNPMCVPKPTPLSMLSMSNGSPAAFTLESSSLAEFLKLHQSSNIRLNSTQRKPQ